MIKSILSNVINYILPYRCSVCLVFNTSSNSLCATCFQKLNFISSPYCAICGFPFEFKIEGKISCAKCIASKPNYDISRSLFKFDQYSKNLIYNFKYNDQTVHGKIFAQLLVNRYKNEINDVDIIAPVPMNRWKRLFRNYNPAQILAEEIVKIIKKPIFPDLLIKTKWTISQTGLNQKRRKSNLQGSIEFNKNYIINNKIILLVDDVKTTGATSHLCSKILRKSGASVVKFISISLT